MEVSEEASSPPQNNSETRACLKQLRQGGGLTSPGLVQAHVNLLKIQHLIGWPGPTPDAHDQRKEAPEEKQEVAERGTLLFSLTGNLKCWS